MKKTSWRFLSIFIAAFIICAGFSCNYAPLENRAVKPANLTTDTRNDFEKDLGTMRTANFEFIFVFRRKDGGEFDGEDKKYLRDNRPAEANRFISTDGDKAFIAGSHYKFPPENLEVLQLRFNVEDYSSAGQGK